MLFVVYIFNHFQVYLATSRTCKYSKYVLICHLKSYGCILGMFEDAYIVDDYNLCKPYDPIIRLFLDFFFLKGTKMIGGYEMPFRLIKYIYQMCTK